MIVVDVIHDINIILTIRTPLEKNLCFELGVDYLFVRNEYFFSKCD